MNWTGGRLQQSRRPKGGISAQQKAYFAKAKARLHDADGSRPPIDLSFFGTVAADRRITSLASISASGSGDSRKDCTVEQRGNWVPRKLDPATLGSRPENNHSNIYLGSEIRARCAPNRYGAREDFRRSLGSKRPTAFRPAQASKRTKREPSTTLSEGKQDESSSCNESITIERKRQELLKRRDWLSSGRVQPLQASLLVKQKQRKVARRRKLTEDDLVRLGQQRRKHPKQGLNAIDSSPHHLCPPQDAVSIRHGTQIHGSQMTQLQVPLPEIRSPSRLVERSEEMLLDSTPDSARARISSVCGPHLSTQYSSPYPPTHRHTLTLQQKDQNVLLRCPDNATASTLLETKGWDNTIAQGPHSGNNHSPASLHARTSAIRREVTTQDMHINGQLRHSSVILPMADEPESNFRSASQRRTPTTFACQEVCGIRDDIGTSNNLANSYDIEERGSGNAVRERTIGTQTADDSKLNFKENAKLGKERQATPEDELHSIQNSPNTIRKGPHALDVMQDDIKLTPGEKVEPTHRVISNDKEEGSPAYKLPVIVTRESIQTKRHPVLHDPSDHGQSVDEQNEAWYRFIFGDLGSCKPTIHQDKRSKAPPTDLWDIGSLSSPLHPRLPPSSTPSPIKSTAVQVASSPLGMTSQVSVVGATLGSPNAEFKAGSSTVDSVALLPVSESEKSMQSNRAVKGTQSEKSNIENKGRDESKERLEISEEASDAGAKRKERVVFTKPVRYEGREGTCSSSSSPAMRKWNRSANYVTEWKIGKRAKVKRRRRIASARGESASTVASGGRVGSTVESGRLRQARRNGNDEEEDEIED